MNSTNVNYLICENQFIKLIETFVTFFYSKNHIVKFTNIVIDRSFSINV